MGMTEIIQLLTGPPNTKLNLVINRKNINEPIEFQILREKQYEKGIYKGNFKNNRYHKLARRFLLDAYPKNCDERAVEKFNEWKRCRLFGASNGKIRTFQDAGNEISFLRRHHPNSMDRINEIENYLSFREDEIENAI